MIDVDRLQLLASPECLNGCRSRDNASAAQSALAPTRKRNDNAISKTDFAQHG